MTLFKKRPAEVQAVIALFDEAKQELEKASASAFPYRYSEAFDLLKQETMDRLDGWTAFMINTKDRGPRASIYAMISFFARDDLQSGQHHIYRGELNPLGLGNDLLRIMDAAVDELARRGVFEADVAQEMKDTVRENIKVVG